MTSEADANLFTSDSSSGEKPINLRRGRITVIVLPSGETLRLRTVQEGRGKRLGAVLPVGSVVRQERAKA